MRLSEVVSIRLGDIDRKGRSIAIVGKGAKHRRVFYDEQTARDLVTYGIHRSKHKFAADTHLLLTQRGPMSANGLDEMLRRRAKDAGLTGVHAHRFRHSFADRWLSDGGGELTLMTTAGWSSPAMLQRYTAARAADRAEAEYRRLRG